VRSHHPGGAEAPGDPLAPAGRGWMSTLPAPSEPEPEAELDPVDLPWPKRLAATDLLHVNEPEGAFYAFARYDADIASTDMARYLLGEGVAVRSGGEEFLRHAATDRQDTD